MIGAIRSMDSTQQSIMISKLSQEISTQKVVDRALIARNILQTGAQIPVIATNTPAQTIITHKITALDKDLQSLAFESQVRKQMMSDTVSNILNYQASQQNEALSIPKVNAQEAFIQNGAIQKGAQQ